MMTPATPKYPRYQDYVIRDGRLIGEFEEMYRDFDDPWHQIEREGSASDKAVGLNLLQGLRSTFGASRVVDIGCGLGHYTHRIAEAGFETIGLDISETAVAAARRRFPEVRFEVGGVTDPAAILDLAPDVVVMTEVTWYVLDHLHDFLAFLEGQLGEAFLLHMLVTYPPGTQKYGSDRFSDLDGILRHFAMTYLESGEVRLANGHRRTWFLGTWRADRLEAWKWSV
jgi:SAM-dependent methyltransferase